MQQCEHSTLYEYSIFPKFQVELTQTNSQCSRPLSRWLIIDCLAKTQRQCLDWTDHNSDRASSSFWIVFLSFPTEFRSSETL